MKTQVPQPSPGGKTLTNPGSPHALLRSLILTCLVFSIPLAYGVGTASAAVTHKYLRQISEVPVEAHGEKTAIPGKLDHPSAVAVDNANGNLFVVDRNRSVDQFSETGEYVSQLTGACTTAGEPAVGADPCPDSTLVTFAESDASSVAVDDATGEVFVSTASAVHIFASTGEYLGQITEVPASSGAGVTGTFQETAGLAFDQATGELYIAVEGEKPTQSESDVVDVFTRQAPGKADFVSQFGDGVLFASTPQTVAVVQPVLGEARVYVTDTEHHVVDVFEGSMGGPPSSSAPPVAVWTGERSLAGSFGTPFVGADPVSGHVYVADREHMVVDELGASVAEESLGRLTGTPTGPAGAGVPFGAALTAPAIDGLEGSASFGDLYVGERSESTGTGVVDVFGPDLKIPEVRAEAPSELGAHSVLLRGTVTLADEAATCSFVWGTNATELTKVDPCEPEHVAGTEGEVAVAAKLAGLTSGTTYYYKLQATNTEPGNGETNTGEAESGVSFTTEGPQFVAGSLSVSEVASTSATFTASLNPNNASTSAFVEYGRCPSLSACAAAGYEARTPVELIGAGDAPVSVEAHVQGLQPGSAYHYRLVALDDVAPGEFDSPEVRTFSTQVPGAFVLPDGRQWEMVSPPQKEGALVQGPDASALWGIAQAADTGAAFTFLTNLPTEPGVAGYANLQQVFSTRTSTGWSSRDLATPHNGSVSASINAGQEYRFFNEELTEGILQPFGAFEPCFSGEGVKQPCLSEQASEQTAFMRNDLTGTYTPLVTDKAPYADDTANQPFGQEGTCPPQKFCGPFFDGATSDGSHVVVNDGSQLTAVAGGGLYEWSQGTAPAEQLQLVSLLPENEGSGGDAALGSQSASDHAGDGIVARHAISEDGSRVFWTNGGEVNHLYLRANIGQPQSPIEHGKCSVPSDACTIEIGQQGEFQDASSDGSRVFYSEGSGLFECEVPADLQCDPVRLGEFSGGDSVIGASEDGSYLYWIAANDDLYEDHLVGGESRLRLIAVLSGANVFNAGPADLGGMTARVSPDGQWLAFMSDRPLTGYDNRDLTSGEPDQEVFLYHAGSGGGAGSLTCASCDPTGARPVGELIETVGKRSPVSPAQAGPEGWLSAVLPGWVPFEQATEGVARYQPRYLSNEGRLFFDSDDALVPKDINENWDVYEYEPEGFKNPEGTHPCTSSSTSGSVVYRPGRAFQVPAEGAVPAAEGEEGAGCVGLISSGESAQESALLDASESGGDVFFMTTAKLAPQDFDEAYDVYDAHECTAASPCIPNPTSPPPACVTADACRTAPTPQPGVYGAPASATFNGIGNLAPAAPKPAVKKVTKKAAKCPKGKVRKTVKSKKGKPKSECVRKPKHKKNR